MAFLEGLLTAAAPTAANFLSGLATGQFKGRPQWKDLQFMSDAATRLTPAEAGRHNTFQDLTYGEDTTRQNERVLQTAETLGMSPWELTGAAPTPMVQAQQQQSNQTNQSAAVLAPMQTAKMQAQTALQTTAMNNQTAKEIAAMQTSNGELPTQQAKTQISQQNLNMSLEALQGAQTTAVQNSTLLATVEALFKTLPEQKISIGPYTVTSKKYFQGIQDIIQQFASSGSGYSGDAMNKEISAYLAKIPANEWQIFRQDLKTAIEETADLAGDVVTKGYNYLKGLALPQ